MSDGPGWTLSDVGRGLVAALSLGAAAIHFAVVGEHWHEHLLYGLFFMVVAWFQVAWAVAVVVRPTRRVYALGVAANVVVLAAYVVAHTSGLPAGPEAWEREPSGALDITCAAFELALVAGSVLLAVRAPSESPRRPLPRVGAAIAAVLVLFVASGTSAALASAGGGEHMDMGHQTSATHDHSTHSTQHDMAGMAGMGGMGSTDATWKYTGPPLPAREVGLIDTVWKATEKGHAMQDQSCTSSPSPQQVTDAVRLVQTTTAAVAKYRDVKVAEADGYRPITSPAYVMVHYLKYGNMNEGDVLDPNHVQSLVYVRLGDGRMVLVAAMYLMPRQGQDGPMPGGCLTQWHAHTNLCMSSKGYYEGFAPCAPGSYLLPTPEMLHVWQVPVPGGPLAVDPTDLQVVQAATMAAGGSSG